MPKRGTSQISMKKVLSHSTKIHRRGAILCFTKILVSKKIMDKRGGGEGGREYQFSPSKFLCLAVPKNKLRRAIFSSINYSGYRKILDRRVAGGGISRISVEIFLFHSEKNLRRGTLLCFKAFRLSKKFIDKRGISRFAVGNFLSHSTEKHWRGTLLCFRKVWVTKTSMHKRGRGNKIFGRLFLVSQYRIIS